MPVLLVGLNTPWQIFCHFFNTRDNFCRTSCLVSYAPNPSWEFAFLWMWTPFQKGPKTILTVISPENISIPFKKHKKNTNVKSRLSSFRYAVPEAPASALVPGVPPQTSKEPRKCGMESWRACSKRILPPPPPPPLFLSPAPPRAWMWPVWLPKIVKIQLCITTIWLNSILKVPISTSTVDILKYFFF